MKKLLFILLFLTLGTAWGGAREDGFAAYERNDYATAVKLWRPLADSGDAYTQYYLGLVYFYAFNAGIARDYKEALKWFNLAAVQGIAKAQWHLALMHYDSRYDSKGVPQDYKEAIKWYRLAAEQGDVLAQAGLGYMYYYGQGVLQDYARAHMWYNLASAAGNALATENRDIIAKKMTPQQIEKAQEMAKACQARNFKGC